MRNHSEGSGKKLRFNNELSKRNCFFATQIFSLRLGVDRQFVKEKKLFHQRRRKEKAILKLMLTT